MTRILIHSNAPWAATGYGQQTALLALRLRDAGHEVAVAANWGLLGNCLDWDGIPVYPGAETYEKVRQNFPAFVRDFAGGELDGCLVITLADVHVLLSTAMGQMNVAAWTPVDHQPAPPRVIEFFARTGARAIAMSRHGEKELEAFGLEPLYVPHGIDTKALSPMDDRAAIREAFGMPEDAFVVGMVARNSGTAPSRKAFPQVFDAFSEVARRHDDALLYLHCDLRGQDEGINLIKMAEFHDIPLDRLGMTGQTTLLKGGLAPDEMRVLYNTFDVLVNPSYGEGFGIPIVEAQACGTPVIVNDWTSMPELCGAGWVVEGDRIYDPAHGAFFKAPRAGDIAACLLDAYEKRGDPLIRETAREFALQYDADRVFEEFWLPTLDALEAPREVPALV